MEVWQASNLRSLRLGEEKKKKEDRNHRAKIQCSHLLHRAAIMKKERRNRRMKI